MGVLDPAVLENLQEMVGGDAEFVLELIDIFFKDAPQMLKDMHQGLDSGDVAILRRAVHSLKSNSAEFGAHTLSALCQELETMCKTDALAGADELVGRIDAEYAQVKVELKKARQEL